VHRPVKANTWEHIEWSWQSWQVLQRCPSSASRYWIGGKACARGSKLLPQRDNPGERANLPIGVAGLVLVYLHLPDYREQNTHPLDIVGLILFGSGIALLSYVLEIFGDHSLGTGEIPGLLALSVVLIAGYGLHAAHIAFPLL
jgi:hypothetical protein